MIDKPDLEWIAIAPELITGIAAIVVMLVGLGSGRLAAAAVRWISLGALAAALVFAFRGLDGAPSLGAWVGQVDSDQLAAVGRTLAAAAGIAAVLWTRRLAAPDGRAGEHHALILAAVCGMGLFCAAGSFVTLFVGLELFSIALYVLCALETERVTSLESGLKYLIVGGLASAVLLYGIALAYGATGQLTFVGIAAGEGRGMLLYTGLAMLIGALAFKASAAPMHWWTPDVYDGAPTTITGFMAAATKAAAFVGIIRVLVVAFGPDADVWVPVVAALATVSILVGNIAALTQDRLKRMLAWSSVAHAGYLLIGLVAWEGVGVAAILYGLVIYVATTLASFSLLIAAERRAGHALTWDDLRGAGWPGNASLGWIAALPALAFTICMLSLAGIPPTGGFFAKLTLFGGAIDAGYAWLALVGAIGSVISLGYYLRVPVTLYLLDADPGSRTERLGRGEPLLATLGVALAVVVLALGLLPSQAFEQACDVRGALLVSVGSPMCSPIDAAAP